MEFLTEYGLFLAKVVTFVVAAIILASVIFSATQRDRSDHEGEGELKIRKLNDQYRKLKESIQSRLMSDAEHKAWQKQKKKEEKAEKKSAKQDKTAEDEK
ncbi:MAG: protease SohB, partial [Marinobacter sp.]|nr:protease SohB [Marinobacter sp.]